MSEITTGVYHDLSNEDYHAIKEINGKPAVSSSYAKAWHKQTPAHANAARPFKSNPIFDIGTATHGWALEGVVPVKGPPTRRGNDWKTAQAESYLAETVALTESDFNRVERMVEELHNNEHIARFLNHPKKVVEASIFAEYGDIVMKCRPDLYVESLGIVIDLKTTVSAEPYAFERQMYNLAYDAQSAYYLKCMQLLKIPVTRFIFANVEKEEPYCTSMVEVGPELMALANETVERVIKEIVEAKETNIYATGWPDLHVAQPPAWLTLD